MSEVGTGTSLVTRLQRSIADLSMRRGVRIAIVSIYAVVILALAFVAYREASYIDRFAEEVPEI